MHLDPVLLLALAALLRACASFGAECRSGSNSSRHAEPPTFNQNVPLQVPLTLHAPLRTLLGSPKGNLRLSGKGS